MSRRWLTMLSAPLVVLVITGCAAFEAPPPSPTPSPTLPPSGVAGRVLIGPSCTGGPPGASDVPGASDLPSDQPGPTFDPDATPEPAPSVDPDATDDPDATPVPAGCYVPYVAKLVISDGLDDSTKARLTSGEDGTFRVDLPPGDYVVVPENGDPFPIAQPVDVTVVAGQYVPVEINYDSGSR